MPAIPSGSLTLTGFAPVNTKVLFLASIPAGVLTLTGFAPVGRDKEYKVDIPRGSLTLKPYAPIGLRTGKTIEYPVVPGYFSSNEEWLRTLTYVVNNIMTGKMNITGDVTLTPNSATTTVSLRSGQLSKNSVIQFFPVSSNAAAELTSLYVTNADKDIPNQQFTITHNNAASTDRKYRYAIIG